MDPNRSGWPASFRHRARSVRVRLIGRDMTTGAAWGLVLAPVFALLFWWLRQGELRLWTIAFGLIGAAAGLAYRLRRRWSDLEVALYLDARLGTDELVTSAVDSRRTEPTLVHHAVLAQAHAALEQADLRRIGPRWWQRRYAAGLMGLGSVAGISLLALPAGPSVLRPEPGQEKVTRAELKALDPIIALEGLDPRDAAQKERLDRIAREAKRLRAELERGLEKREALARVAKLRDEVAAERLLLGDGSTRAGLEAAVRKLQSQPETAKLGKALGQGDLTEFDREMQRLANLAEGEARARAKQALEQARDAAAERRAQAIAEMLERQSRQFAEREGKASALRELARALGDKLSEEAKRDLEEFGASGDPRTAERLTRALEKALAGLSPEERKRLAQRLEQRLGQNGSPHPVTQQELERLVRRLSSAEGQKELARALKELAKPQPGPDARREQKLDDAERGGAQAQRELGAIPLPIETPSGQRPGAQQREPRGASPQASGPPGPGSKHDSGRGSHPGKTEPITAEALRSKANAWHNPAYPMQGTSLGRAPGRSGEKAERDSSGALGSTDPNEVGGTERSEVPREYREQVGRYFSP